MATTLGAGVRRSTLRQLHRLLAVRRRRVPPLVASAGKAALGLSLLGLLVWYRREDLVLVARRGVVLHYLALAGTLLVFSLLTTFYRWWLLVRAQDLPFQLREAIKVGFIGYLSSLVLPSALGGDVVKSVIVARAQSRRTVAVATILVDRLVGLVGLTWLVGGAAMVVVTSDAGVVPEELRRIAVVAVIVMAVITTVFLVVWWPPVTAAIRGLRLTDLPWIGAVLEELLAAVAVYRDRWRSLVVALGLSVASHMATLLSLWVGGLAVWEEPISIATHFLVTPVALLFGILPISPGGLGVTELAVDRLIELAGASGSDALVMMLAHRAVQLVIVVAGGLLVLSDVRRVRASARDAKEGDSSPVAR